MRKPTMCGNNRLHVPESGCGDCAELEYRIKQIEDWINNPLTAADIEELTPIECFEPPGSDSRTCVGTACQMIVGCDEDISVRVCEAKVCATKAFCK